MLLTGERDLFPAKASTVGMPSLHQRKAVRWRETPLVVKHSPSDGSDDAVADSDLLVETGYSSSDEGAPREKVRTVCTLL